MFNVTKQKEYRRKYDLSHPWAKTINNVRTRCNYPNNSAYKRYGAKGIKCLITIDDVKRLWFRDKAYLMKKPSIDRINPEGNYEYSNCRYLELSKNIGSYYRNKKSCIRGHKLEGSNLIIRNGARRCRECINDSQRRRYRIRTEDKNV